jgi:hypothetical protein
MELHGRLDSLGAATNRAACVTLAMLLLLAACSRTGGPPRRTPDYETLLLLQADFLRYAQYDLYRAAPPLDLSGQNVFRATLARLDYFETTNPSVNTDVVDFLRGQASTRLGDYASTVEAFGRVAETSKSPEVAAKAQERLERVWLLREAVQSTEQAGNLGEYFAQLERRRTRLTEIEEQFAGSYDAVLARRELEQADVEYALALFRNRFLVEGSSRRALEFGAEMVERHASSRRAHEHRLMLGRFYLELAEDLASLSPPDRSGFDAEVFYRLAQAAQREFVSVSLADGYDEKLEAEGLLRTLESFTRRVRNLER